MAGYLDQYGAGDARREKIVKTAGMALAAVLVIVFTVFNVYTHLIIHSISQRLGVRLDMGRDVNLIAGKQ